MNDTTKRGLVGLLAAGALGLGVLVPTVASAQEADAGAEVTEDTTEDVTQEDAERPGDDRDCDRAGSRGDGPAVRAAGGPGDRRGRAR
ncbi:hypothetical protein FTX61_05780 [Nitriliruptoraceae bacterium ZYF776]|nr:hypothetical protein [Profundirhabdus halotolerans]